MRGRCEGVQGGVVKGTRGWCEVVEWDGVEVNLQYSYIHHTMHKVSLLSNLQIGIPSVRTGQLVVNAHAIILGPRNEVTVVSLCRAVDSCFSYLGQCK